MGVHHPGYVTATPLPSFVDGEKTSWLRLRSPSEEAIETVQSWKALPHFSAESLCVFFGAKKNNPFGPLNVQENIWWQVQQENRPKDQIIQAL